MKTPVQPQGVAVAGTGSCRARRRAARVEDQGAAAVGCCRKDSLRQVLSAAGSLRWRGAVDSRPERVRTADARAGQGKEDGAQQAGNPRSQAWKGTKGSTGSYRQPEDNRARRGHSRQGPKSSGGRPDRGMKKIRDPRSSRAAEKFEVFTVQDWTGGRRCDQIPSYKRLGQNLVDRLAKKPLTRCQSLSREECLSTTLGRSAAAGKEKSCDDTTRCADRSATIHW